MEKKAFCEEGFVGDFLLSGVTFNKKSSFKPQSSHLKAFGIWLL